MSSSQLRQRASAAPNSTSAPKSSVTQEKVRIESDPISSFFLLSLLCVSILAPFYVPLPHPYTIALAFGLYALGSFCDTAGYHRLWAHRSYEAFFLVRLFLAIFGAGNFTGSILSWARNHRAHHRQVDTAKDPFNRTNGFFYAFLGHHFVNKAIIGEADISDLKKDWVVSLQSSLYLVLAPAVGWFLPALIASFWNDPYGGLVYAGVLRSFVFIVLQSLLWALGRTYGRSPYNGSISAKNNIVVSLLTFGDGHLNFHYEFPTDYRSGCFYYHYDPTKWIIRALSLVGLVSKMNKTPREQALRVRFQKKQEKLDALRREITFGPEPESLPVWDFETFEKKVAEGEQLIIIDNIVHDLKGFFDDHPGGAEVLMPKIGKDATIAFNGGVQRHSKAARNLATFMRIAVVDKLKDRKKTTK